MICPYCKTRELEDMVVTATYTYDGETKERRASETVLICKDCVAMVALDGVSRPVITMKPDDPYV